MDGKRLEAMEESGKNKKVGMGLDYSENNLQRPTYVGLENNKRQVLIPFEGRKI